MERVYVNKKYRGKSILTQKELDRLKDIYTNKGWNPAKWMDFCDHCLQKGYQIERYAAKSTESNYITVYHKNRSFKVRFSTHQANRQMEYAGDSDFYVGRTVSGYRSTADAIEALDYYMTTGKFYTWKDVKDASKGRKQL